MNDEQRNNLLKELNFIKFDFKKKKKIIVSFSGGKDSTAMVLRMIELNEHIDEVICCDTYKEFPAMYRHINKVRKFVEMHGIKFTMLKSEKSFDYYMFEHKPKRKKIDSRKGTGFSWPGSRQRWCTSRLKIDIVNRYLKYLNSKYDVVQCIGIAADEQYRLERKNNRNEKHRYPLVEWGWDEKYALSYCYKKGYDWEGLYELFDRVSCWCCPLQPMKELRILYERFPDLWGELKDMDNRTWRNFRADYSINELEIKFNLEKEFESKNKSIKSREFYQKLNERLKK